MSHLACNAKLTESFATMFGDKEAPHDRPNQSEAIP